jgi:hypothetical protein
MTSKPAMTAQIIPFPRPWPFVVTVQDVGSAYLVVAKSHGWLHAHRSDAVKDAEVIADGFGVDVRILIP